MLPALAGDRLEEGLQSGTSGSQAKKGRDADQQPAQHEEHAPRGCRPGKERHAREGAAREIADIESLARKVTVQAILSDHQNLVRASAASLAGQLTKSLRTIAGEA